MSQQPPFMLMLTKMLKPTTKRISRITTKITLPRAIPVVEFWAAIIGGFAFLPIFGLFFGLYGGVLGAFVGGGVGVWLVKWKPWRGESLLRVIRVRVRAAKGKKVAPCPGSLAPVAIDPSGAEFCPTCGLICEVELLTSDVRVAARHTWRRKIYIGQERIRPLTGVLWVAPGSIPTQHADTRK